MTALPAPADEMLVEPAPAEAIAETATPLEPAPPPAEAPAAPATKRVRAPKAAAPDEGDYGLELPFDVPPKS